MDDTELTKPDLKNQPFMSIINYTVQCQGNVFFATYLDDI